MKGERDEGKQMVPFFPGLHISDGDKGGPRAPPRNKMALFEEYSVNSQGPELRPGPRPLLPVVPSGNGCSAFVSQASSSNVAGVKRKVRPILAAMNECPHSPEWYYSHYSNGVSGPTNYPNPTSSTNLMMKAKCLPGVQPPYAFSSYTNCCTDENDFGVSSYLQSGKMLNYGNLHLHVKKEKIDTSISKLSKEAKSKDCANIGEEQIRLSQNNSHKVEFKSLHKSKTVGDDISAIRGGRRRSSSFIEDLDSLSLKIGDSVKREETSDSYAQEDSIPGLDLATDEVVRVIGQRLFLKARKTMVHQQKIFSLQMFELHRLITVQRHIAKSPEILHENTFESTKPNIKFPPINKLLYVSPLDQSPPISKPKLDPLKSNFGTDFGSEALCGLEKVEKGLLPHQKPLPNPPSISIDPKLAPFCLPVPTGNQWLVPVRSPSEGLIYKPYPGPCIPSVGFMGPVYGNYRPISLSSFPSTEQGNELSQSYLQSYAMPMMNSSSLSLDLDKGSSSNYIAPHQPPSKASTGAVVSEGGGNLHRSNGSEMQGETTSSGERADGDALSLFPTTPSFQKNEQRVHAIKVVPHNRMSALASAARIFQSIQEERRKQE